MPRWLRALVAAAVVLSVAVFLQLVVVGDASAATVTSLTTDQLDGIAAGEDAFVLAMQHPELYDDVDHTFNWTVAESDHYGDLPTNLDTQAETYGGDVFRYQEELGQDDPLDTTLGPEEYAALGEQGVFTDAALSTALADGSGDVTVGLLPGVITSGLFDSATGVLGDVALGAAGGAFVSLLLNPSSAGTLNTVQSSGFVGTNPVTSWSLTTDMNSDGTAARCVDTGAATASTWSSECSGVGTSTTQVDAPDATSGWSVVNFGLAGGSAVGSWPVAVTGACSTPGYSLPLPFISSLSFGISTGNASGCGDGAGGFLDAQQQVDFVAPSDVGIGPIQLGGPPTGAGAPSVSTLAQPSYSTLLSEVTAAYGSTAPVDDFQRGVVAAVNGGTEVDGSTPGSDAAARIIEAEEGTPSGVAEACLNATADGCVATLDAAGYAATNEGPEAVGRYQLPYPNGFDPVGTAEMLNPLSVMNDVNGSEVFGEQWAVHMNLDTTTGNDHVLPGSAVGVYSEPADVVPRCDGSGRSTASWGTYGPMYYPMQFSDCLTALGGGGFSNVVEEPLSGAMWGDFWGCGGDPCDAGDPSGTVEWMTTTDPTTYSSGSYSWNYAGGAQVTPLTQPIFVYVEGWDGAVVGAPPVTTTTGTTTTGSTSTGTTTTGSTDTSTTGSTSTATTQSTDTSTTGSTSTSTTQSTDTSTTGSTSTSTTQSTDTSTTGSTSTSTTQSTDTGTDTTTTTTPSDNCVVSDTCDPPNPFNGPTTDPSGIHFPVVHTPCTVFPFGVPCYVASQVEALNQTPVPPGMTVAIPIPGSGGHKASASFNLGQLPFDINSYMWAVRDFFLILTGVGIVLWLTRRGSQGGDSGDGGAGGSSDQESGYINWEDV